MDLLCKSDTFDVSSGSPAQLYYAQLLYMNPIGSTLCVVSLILQLILETVTHSKLRFYIATELAGKFPSTTLMLAWILLQVRYGTQLIAGA